MLDCVLALLCSGDGVTAMMLAFTGIVYTLNQSVLPLIF